MLKGDHTSSKIINQHGPSGFVMFIAFVGALIYFMEQARGFGEVLLAFLKALVWPGYLIYHALQALGA